MQSRPQTNGRGVVQWVVPPRKISKAANRHNSNNANQDNKSSYSDADETSIKSDTQPTIDLSLCKTICTFIEEHLRELQKHQALIDRARSKLVNSNLLNNVEESTDLNAIARNIWRLKVRDEQTNAIETIKRLTDYLRELTQIEKQVHSSKCPINDDVVDRLSDFRAKIIQSLNDFVLSNNDLDVPISYSEDNCFDYDFCTDVPTPSKIRLKYGDRFASNSCDSAGLSRSHNNSASTASIQKSESLGEGADEQNQQYVINSNAQILNLERRRKEVEKLEKDTEELRRLFSDFYGLVKTQGEQIDTIEDNIVIAAQRVGEGHQNLNKTMRGLTVLMPVTGCMAGALIGGPVGLVIGGKLGGITIGCASSLLGLISSYSIQRCVSLNKIKDD